MDTIENKENEEVLEEIEEIPTEEVKDDNIVVEQDLTLEDNESKDNQEEVLNVDGEENVSEAKEDAPQEETTEYEYHKNKVPIIIILSILLVLDIAALVIYLIGIDKVVSFIK